MQMFGVHAPCCHSLLASHVRAVALVSSRVHMHFYIVPLEVADIQQSKKLQPTVQQDLLRRVECRC
jgi:hypothetical protein